MRIYALQIKDFVWREKWAKGKKGGMKEEEEENNKNPFQGNGQEQDK